MPESTASITTTEWAVESGGDGTPASNLTTSQYLMWMGQKLHPSVPLYNMIHTFEVHGALDPALFQQAFQAVLDRSDALRTIIVEQDGGPVQRVRPPFAYTVPVIDLTDRPDPETALDAWIDARRVEPLPLDQALFDTALLKLAPNRYVWYFTQHHIITDIWATALVYQHVQACYALARDGRLEEAPDLPPFRHYVTHERSFRASPRFERTAAYWQDQRQALPEPARLYGRRSSQASNRTERVRCDLGPERSARLRALAQTPEVRALTPHLTLFSVFAALLFAYVRRVSGQRHLAIGTPSHNRPTAAFKETIGLFIEVFPFHVDLDDDETFLSLIRKVQHEALRFFRYAQPGTSSAAANRSYNVLLNYLHASFAPDFAGLPMTSAWVHSGYGDSSHHLRLQVHDLDDTGAFRLYVDFNADLFDEAQREAAVGHVLNLFDALLDDPAQRITQPGLLTAAERRRVLAHGQPTPPVYDAPPSVLALIAAQTVRTPDAAALVFEGETVSYRALDERTNQLAWYLRARGVGPEVRVGLCLERSIDAVVAMLGVLKAGGAYVPMDPHYPTGRLAFMLDDAQVAVVLTHGSLASDVPAQEVRFVQLDAEAGAIAEQAITPLPDTPSAAQAAYVIYTSGSTGHPKGVVVEHGALAHYIGWARTFYLAGQPHDFPLFTPLAVDLTVTSIYAPLTVGGRVVVYGADANPARLVARVVQDDAVDALKLTPSHFALLQHLTLPASRIKTLILGGEDLKTDLAHRMHTTFGDDAAIYNEYGPTEATVGCMIHRFDPTRDTDPSVPIGGPAVQTRLYVLDDALNPVPEDVAGELYLAGPTLARGYLGRPDLTAERFLPDPFHPGARMYRTGDRVRWRRGGVLDYLGRTDQQVKIRGARIELGEVESALLAHPAIEAGVVTVASFERHDGEVTHCTRCGLASTYPDVSYDAEGVCHLCRAFDRYQAKAQQYFRSMRDLEAIFAQARPRNRGSYDCLMLLSGGKDSTYALARLVDMGLTVLTFTLDNGYISDEAKANIRRVTDTLGVDHVFGETPAMNAIFVDSLTRFSNVCNGCFKTIYTLALQLAREQHIPIIVTGLSRGQFFETRLTESLFLDESMDPDRIDRVVLEARKAYHRVDDAVARLLDVDALQDDALFEHIQFVDFYRYCDASLDEMLAYLDEHLPWIRPTDTGRSTNCLINDVGIYVHQKERGFHNYALPYSWDVRMEHKERDAALDELDDEIDEANVQRILREIGYDSEALHAEQREHRLAAYYVSPAPLTASELRAFVADRLPEYMVPSHFVHLDALPLNPTGKVDRRALPHPETQRPELANTYTAPRTEAEAVLARVWAEVLRIQEVGVHDNFFDLGGESILAIQISARASEAGVAIAPGLIFHHQTVAELAAAARATPVVEAEQGLVTGAVPLTPIQHWFFDHEQPEPQHWNQAWLMDTAEPLDEQTLTQAVAAVLRHHDALRLRFTETAAGWQQTLAGMPAAVPVTWIDLTALPPEAQDQALAEHETRLHASLDLQQGPLLRVAYVDCGPHRSGRLLVLIHHLAVDGVSWRILLEDLETAYRQRARGEPVALPRKTTSYKAWAEGLVAYTQTDPVQEETAYWRHALGTAVDPLPLDYTAPPRCTEADARTLTVTLPPDETEALLHAAPGARHARIQELLLAALAAALRTWEGPRRLRVDVEGHGREAIDQGEDVSRTVGWFTSLIPFVLPLDAADPIALLKDVKERWRQIPGRGLGYGLLRYLAEDAALAAAPPADVLFNYLGRLDQLVPAETTLLRPARPLVLSRSPRLQRAYRLEVNAFVEQEQLHVAWSYGTPLHGEATMRRAAEAFLDALRTFVEPADRSDGSSVTASDFPLANLDAQQLDKVAALLRKADRNARR